MSKRLELTPEQIEKLHRDYFVQSETVRGEPRVHYAETYARRSNGMAHWFGPSRRTAGAAWIDAQWHVAERFDERPRCFAYQI